MPPVHHVALGRVHALLAPDSSTEVDCRRQRVCGACSCFRRLWHLHVHGRSAHAATGTASIKVNDVPPDVTGSIAAGGRSGQHAGAGQGRLITFDAPPGSRCAHQHHVSIMRLSVLNPQLRRRLAHLPFGNTRSFTAR
jgi:hypothetical protein